MLQMCRREPGGHAVHDRLARVAEYGEISTWPGLGQRGIRGNFRSNMGPALAGGYTTNLSCGWRCRRCPGTMQWAPGILWGRGLAHWNRSTSGETADFFGDGGSVDAVVAVEVADGAGLAEMFDPK